MRRHALLCLTLSTMGTMGCQLERLYPIEVGEGAARLTVANTGALLQLANGNAECGFDSALALENTVVEGELGAVGTATTTITACIIDLGPAPVSLGADCSGSETKASGLVILTGTRTVEGLLTGDAATPIIPQQPDAVRIALAADTWGFHVLMGADGPNLVMGSGHIDVDASVHLARSASLGVCSVPTNEVTLNRIAVRDAVYTMDDGEGRVFPVDVPSAELNAQVGAYNGVENVIGGTITVWDEPVDLGAAAPLDPDYTRATFESSSFSCSEDLQLPVDYTCPSLAPLLADGAAKLTVSTVGNIVSVFSKDTSCGLKSPAVIAAARVEGELGRAGGSVTYVVDTPCEIDFGTSGRVVGSDCNGNATTVYGKARFTGSLAIHGRLTGNPATPVIPANRTAVDITISRLELEGAEVRGMTEESMTVKSGVISGSMHPQLAMEAATGACSYDIPAVRFDNLAWAPGADVVIHSGTMALGLAINGSSLTAQSGQGIGVMSGLENHLEGTIVVDTETFQVPLDGQPATLDPTYDRAAFYDGFLSCTEGVRLLESDDECSMRQTIGDGVARLIVQTVGTVAGLINSDAICGFANTLDVLANPTSVIGEHGEQGSLSWEIDGCTVGNSLLGVYATDCLGGETFLGGTADVDSVRTVYGEREAAVDLFFFGFGESIIPTDPRSIDLWIESTELHEFSTYGMKPGEEPLGILTIHEGTLEAFVQPATGENLEGGGFIVPTPVATMSGVRLHGARATLEAQGMIFEITIEDTQLAATNGRVDGVENAIAGTVTVDGETIAIGGALDPGFDPSLFDAAYACTQDLASVIHLP